jgi:predicted site-specific integrase-resolvase
MKTQSSDGLLTKIETAEQGKVSSRTVDNWMRNGLLPYIKLGKGNNAIVRIRRSDLEEMLNTHRIDKSTRAGSAA